MTRLIGILLVSMSTAGAWTAPSFKRPDISCELADSGAGLVLFSSSMAEPNSLTDPVSIWYHFNRVGRSSFSDIEAMISREQFIKEVPSDFEGSFGKLYAIKADAGDYEFKKWTYAEVRAGERSSTMRSPKKALTRLPFKVAPGRVVYLGSLAPSMVSGELSVTIAEQSQRDLQVFARKCPNVDAGKIDIQPLKAGVWN